MHIKHAERHIKITLGVGAIDLERARHALRQAHEAHVILDQALKIIWFIQGKLGHRVPRLLLQPKPARLGIRLGIAPRWCEFIHYVWPKIPKKGAPVSLGLLQTGGRNLPRHPSSSSITYALPAPTTPATAPAWPVKPLPVLPPITVQNALPAEIPTSRTPSSSRLR